MMNNLIIAIIGVSSNREKYGYKVFKDLISKNYKVYGINPKYNNIEGYRIYSNIEKLPEKPNIVVFVVKPDIAFKIVKKIKDKCKEAYLWFQPGSENEEIENLCVKEGLRCVFHRCIMRETDKDRLILSNIQTQD